MLDRRLINKRNIIDLRVCVRPSCSADFVPPICCHLHRALIINEPLIGERNFTWSENEQKKLNKVFVVLDGGVIENSVHGFSAVRGSCQHVLQRVILGPLHLQGLSRKPQLIKLSFMQQPRDGNLLRNVCPAIPFVDFINCKMRSLDTRNKFHVRLTWLEAPARIFFTL